MDQTTQTQSRPIAGDKSKANAVVTAQANATDDGISGTSGTSLGSRQDVRPEPREVNKRSLDYVLRSGCAGGLAGCAVSECLVWCTRRLNEENTDNSRQKQLSHHLTESKSSSKRRTLNLPNIPGAGLV